MVRQFPTSVLLSIIVLIALTNAAAFYWHLYFYYPWLDIPLHFFGGLWVALYALAWYYGTSWLKEKDETVAFVFAYAISATLLVGLGWELFEFSLETIVAFSEHDLGDTLLDLVMDTLGALVAGAVFVRKGYNKTT